MPFVNWDPGTRRGRAALLPFTEIREPIGIVERDDDPSFGSAFAAAIRRENTILSAIEEINSRALDVDDPTPPDWNPYRYIEQNWAPDQIQRMGAFIADGQFDDVYSPRQLQVKARELEEERRLIDQMYSHTGGMLTGALVAGILDPTSYIPFFGQLNRGSRMIRIGRLAARVGAQVAASEAILQQTQDQRTLTESFLNIGTGAFIGGGIGVFTLARRSDNPLNPKHPNNPTRTDVDDDLIAYDGEGGIDIIRTRESTTGAAEVPDGPVVREGADVQLGRKPNARAGLLRRAIQGATPNSRMFLRVSSVARSLGIRMTGGGGIMTRGNVEGIATRASAEDIMRDVLSQTYNQLQISAVRLLKEANEGIGKLSAKRISEEDFNATARRFLKDDLDQTHTNAMIQKYGTDGWERLRQSASQYAEEIHGVNGTMEKKLVEMGALRDEARLASLKDRIQQFNEAKKALQEQKKQLRETRTKGLRGDEAKAERTRIETAAADIDAKIKELEEATNVAALRSARDQELAKPASLGRDYGHAQLWNQTEIIHNFEEFKGFLMDVLGTKPEGNWLRERFDLDEADFEDLATSNPTRHREIMEEWAGDEYYVRIARLEHQLDAAQHVSRQAELDLGDLLRQDKLLRKEQGRIGLNQAKRLRDQYVTRLETQRQRVATAKAHMRAGTETIVRERQRAFDAMSEFGNAGRPPRRPKLTTAMAAQKATAREAVRVFRSETARLRRLESQLQRYDDAVRKADNAAYEVGVRRQNMDVAVATAKKARNISAKTTAELKRALLKGQKKPPLEEVVNDLANKMAEGGPIPGGLSDDIAGTTGRVKERFLRLTREQRRQAEASRFLRTDLPGILESQYQSLAGYIGLRDAYNIRTDGTGSFRSWGGDEDSVLSAIRQDYRRLVNEATTPSEKAQLENELRAVLRDMNGLKDRILGTVDLGAQRDGYLMFMSRNMRRLNLQRYMPTFLLGSLTDVATVAFRHKLMPAMVKHGDEVIDILRGATKNDLTQLALASEIAHGAVSAMKRVGEEDLFNAGGVGVRGTKTHAVTSAIDQTMAKGVNLAATVSLMPVWNR